MTNCQVMEDNSICFNFWFEMTHSSGIEKLEIHMEGQRDLTRIKVWEFQQKHLDFWEEGRVELHKLAHEDFKIVIVAERGDLQSGYVALDDFHFETSEQEEFCSTKPRVRCCTDINKNSHRHRLGNSQQHNVSQNIHLHPKQDAEPSSTPSPTTTASPSPPIGEPLPNCTFDGGPENATCGWEIRGLEFKWSIQNDGSLNEGHHQAPVGEHPTRLPSC